MTLPRWLTMTLFAVPMFAVAAHVCVVPHGRAADLHPHPWDAAVTAEGPFQHGDEPNGDDAIHQASCTALCSPYAPFMPALVTVVPVSPELVSPLTFVSLPAPGAHASNPPPLFLLHAALLI